MYDLIYRPISRYNIKRMMKVTRTKKNLLVFLEKHHYNPLVMKKAEQLAMAFNTTIDIVIMFDVYEEDQEDELQFIKSDLESFSTTSQVTKDIWFEELRSESDYLKILKERYKLKAYSQLVSVNEEEHFLDTMIYGSMSQMVQKYFPESDFHLLSINLLPFKKDEFESGKFAYLNEELNGDLTLVCTHEPDKNSGLYFRRLSTDFENGLFLTSIKNGTEVYKIVDRIAIEKIKLEL